MSLPMENESLILSHNNVKHDHILLMSKNQNQKSSYFWGEKGERVSPGKV